MTELTQILDLAPSHLAGEGWGEGATTSHAAQTLPVSPPSPQPSPVKGEGAKSAYRKPLKTMRYITFLRHGLTSQPGLYHGHNDVSLSDTGLAQMQTALANLPSVATRVVSSPLIRCANVAQAYANENALPIELNHAWMELDFGAWTGRSAADILQSDAEKLGAFWRNPLNHAPPGGEPLQHAAARVLAAWNALPPDENLLIVTHGGVMRLLFCQLLGLPLSQLWSVDVHYAAHMTWLCDESGTRLHHLHPGFA